MDKGTHLIGALFAEAIKMIARGLITLLGNLESHCEPVVRCLQRRISIEQILTNKRLINEKIEKKDISKFSISNLYFVKLVLRNNILEILPVFLVDFKLNAHSTFLFHSLL